MAELTQVLRHVLPVEDPNVLVGHTTGDDAAVYRLSEDRALVVTADFFTPIVDDPYEFGRIAAANALSDIYAMGGRPLFVLNLVGFPRRLLPEGLLEEILRGGSDMTRAAGVPTIGGHSIDDGREEIRGHDQRTIFGETIDRGVVSGDVPDQNVGVFDGEHVTQNLRQLGHAEFTRSTGAMTELGQPDFRPRVPRLFDHAISSLGVCGCSMRKVERKHGGVHGYPTRPRLFSGVEERFDDGHDFLERSTTITTASACRRAFTLGGGARSRASEPVDLSLIHI